MTLEASARDVVLDAEEVDKVALTFTWTPAREMPDDYLLPSSMLKEMTSAMLFVR